MTVIIRITKMQNGEYLAMICVQNKKAILQLQKTYLTKELAYHMAREAILKIPEYKLLEVVNG